MNHAFLQKDGTPKFPWNAILLNQIFKLFCNTLFDKYLLSTTRLLL